MVSVTIISLTTVIFGIAALLLASRARTRLSPGSLRSYIDNFSVCLSFIVIFSLWQTARSVFELELSLGEFANYPELIFIVFAYISFIIASFRVVKISEEFGFKGDGKLICKLIKKNPKKKKKG
ncbi:hypothetical protein ISS05_05630 [Candidatus Woesearchaeota archaeon]|nr:hypothetical protein [Candidatus Woesearchaeota archaeon]